MRPINVAAVTAEYFIGLQLTFRDMASAMYLIVRRLFTSIDLMEV
jgi:hypothetical protein